MSALQNLGDNLKQAAQEAAQKAASQLVAMTRAHMVEEANKKLHTRRQMFVDGLSHAQVDENTWVISLAGKVKWIDEGIEPHNMLPDLLASPKAKTSKDGGKYLIIPFHHGPKGPTQMTPAQSDLLTTIKSELKRRQIPYSKIEVDANGLPKLGKLHTLNITNAPLKTKEGPGQGHGLIGQVRQGNTGIPFLQGLNVYQRQVGGKVRRELMSFRIASSKHFGSGKWQYPGLEPGGFFDEAETWAAKTWAEDVGPALIADLKSQI